MNSFLFKEFMCSEHPTIFLEINSDNQSDSEGVENHRFEIKDIPYYDQIIERIRNDDKLRPFNPRYMEMQTELKKNDRKNLVEWIINIGFESKLTDYAICMAVRMFDILISTKKVDRNDLQLIGATLLLMETKISEPNRLSITSEIYKFTNFLPDTLVSNETKLFQELDFNVIVPTPIEYIQYHFGEFWSLDEDNDSHIETLRFIMYCSISCEECLKYSCENISLACLLITFAFFKKEKRKVTDMDINGICIVDVFNSVKNIINDTTTVLFSYFSSKIETLEDFFKIEAEKFLSQFIVFNE